MYKIWFGLAFAAIVVNPASAQDYRKNLNECVKELGLEPVPGSYRIESDGGRLHRRAYYRSEAQVAVLNDCVTRKASLASKPSGNGRRRTAQ
jgi:hypothetical protein